MDTMIDRGAMLESLWPPVLRHISAPAYDRVLRAIHDRVHVAVWNRLHDSVVSPIWEKAEP